MDSKGVMSAFGNDLRRLPLFIRGLWYRRPRVVLHETKYTILTIKVKIKTQIRLAYVAHDPGGLSGAEEDGFALEGFDGEEERYGGVDAGGEEDEGDGIPVVGAGHDFLADQTGVENGDEGELGGELHTGHHRGDRRNDRDKGNGREIALGFFVSFGKKREIGRAHV